MAHPALVYGMEAIAITKGQEKEMEGAEMGVLRFSIGKTRLDMRELSRTRIEKSFMFHYLSGCHLFLPDRTARNSCNLLNIYGMGKITTGPQFTNMHCSNFQSSTY